MFAKANDLGDVDRRELLSYALEQAKDAGLVPALRIPVGVRTEEGEVTKHVEVFKGQDVLERSAAFAREWALNEDMADRLRSHIVEAARAERLLPIMILPVEVPVLKKSGGDRRVLAARLEIFRGDTAEEAAARAVEALEEEVEEGIMTALAKAAREAGVARRIFPMLRLNATIQTSEANATVEVELYRGDNVTEAVARAASRAGLLKGKETEGELLAALAAQTRAQAVRARVLPTLTVPVDLPSGNAEPLNLFLGDNITQVVEAWGKVHGLEGDDLEELQQATLERAQAARVAPILSISVRLGPEQGGSAPLELFQGDNVTAAVRAFMARHGLATGGERERSLVADVTSAAVDLRLLPQHEVPVRATTQPGEGRPAREIEAVFHFFKGDDLRTAAAAFVDEKELGASSLPGLLRFLEQKIPLPSEGSHSELQP